MDVNEAVQRRMSVRAFRPDPVPETTLRKILQVAQRAPSGGNLQPWRVYALTGEPLANFKRVIVERMAEKPMRDEKEYEIYPPNLWDPLRRRRTECGEDLYATIAIAREDRPARLAQLAKNFTFFGAPVALFICLDRRVGPPQWADVGMYMQTLMLLAVEQGLDTCPQEAWAQWPKTVAEFVGMPPDHMLFAGIALGYRDHEAPINSLRTRREPVDEVVTFMGF